MLFRRMLLALLVSIAVTAALAVPCGTARCDDQRTIVELTVHPAPEPAPALRYRLLPPRLERTPGNAAPLYGKAFLMLAQTGLDDAALGRIVEWSQSPPSALSRQEIESTVPFRSAVHYAEMAARREHCDWAMPLREEENVFAILLPELGDARNVGRLLALKARLEIGEGKHDEAIRTLQSGYAMARHVSEQSFVVSALVGAAIAEIMTGQVAALIESPDAPNLYWALSALPDPLIDMGESIELEAVSLYLLFPDLPKVRDRILGEAEANRIMTDCLRRLRELSGDASGDGQPGLVAGLKEMATLGYFLAQVPRAKTDLKAMGYSDERLDAMPATQVVLLHVVETYERARDDMFKWFHVPFWQSRQGIAEAERKVGELRKREIVPVASLLLPALGRMNLSQARLDRRIAALRCVEAIRMEAAARGGKLPAGLDEIERVPIPINPVTGAPFPYRLDGDAAILDADGPPGEPSEQYRIRLTPRR